MKNSPATNSLRLSVAGSGKTQAIVNECFSMAEKERVLALTYTTANQQEIVRRLGTRVHVEVSGWFAFLLDSFVRPYLPLLYPGRRLEGFDFKSPPQRGTSNGSISRYFTREMFARKVHLAQLAHRICEASEGKPLARLRRIYDRMFVDEAQDLSGWDLELLKLLLRHGPRMTLVGDVRQAILATNPRDPKNSKCKYVKVIDWFRAQERAKLLKIEHASTTFRCRQEIASFADSLFSPEMGFEATVSENNVLTGHDGLFLVAPRDVRPYCDLYHPKLLRWSAASGREWSDLAPMNIGVSKGLGFDRVLIHPTDKIASLLRSGTPLETTTAAYLYVAVTRARQSVAFILDDAGSCAMPRWSRKA